MVKRTRCTYCGSSDGNTIYSDGHSFCFVCRKHINAKSSTKSHEHEHEDNDNMSNDKQKSLAYYSGLPCVPVHGVSKDVAEEFGIRAEIDVVTGLPEKIYYPYFSINGELVAYKGRDVESKQFFWVGNRAKATLFGQQRIPKSGKLLMIVEGEKDALAATELFRQLGKKYNVISIRDGANSSHDAPRDIASQLEVIEKFESVVVAMDNDDVGQSTQKAIAELLVTSTSVRLWHYADGFKDAHDVLDKGNAKMFYELLANSKEYRPEYIISGEDISFEEVRRPLQAGFEIPFSGLQDKLQGFRKGELTTITAGTGSGKSTLSRQIAYNMIKAGLRTANIFLEETKEKTVQGFIALDNKVPLGRLRASPNIISDEAAKTSFDNLIANGRTFFFNHFGGIQSDVLIQKMKYFAKALNVDYIFLDHLSIVVSGSDEINDERKTLDSLCTKLAAFCTETNVGVIMVAHLRKKGAGETSANAGGQITLDDLRGSQGIAQLSHNVVAVIRNTTADDVEESNKIKLFVLKNREWGQLGDAGSLKYNRFTGLLEEI